MVNYITDGVDNQSFAPIHTASHHGHCKMIVALLDGGADVNCVGGSTKETPVVLAVSDSSHKVILVCMYIYSLGKVITKLPKH